MILNKIVPVRPISFLAVCLLSAALITGCASSGTPLYNAIKAGQIDNARTMINKGQYINDSTNGATPLISSAFYGYTNLVRLLIDNGADLEAKNNHGVTALMWASTKGHLDIAKILVESGADINAKDNKGSAALSDASRNGHLKIAKLLIKKGGAINATSKEGFAAIHTATNKGHSSVAKLLIENGADLNGKTSSNSVTPFLFACRSGMLKVVKILMEKGADINYRDKEEASSLSWASIEGRKRVFKFLMDQGAEPYIISEKFSWNGKTYRMAAEYEEKKDNNQKASEYYSIASEQYELAAGKTKNKKQAWDYKNRAEKYRKKKAALGI